MSTALDNSSLPPAFDSSPSDDNQPADSGYGDDFAFEREEFGDPKPSPGGGSSDSGERHGAGQSQLKPPATVSGAGPSSSSDAPAGDDNNQTAPAFSEDDYRAAAQFGMGREEVDSFGSIERLDAFIGRVYTAAQQAFSSQTGGQDQNSGQQDGQQVPAGGNERQPGPSQPSAGGPQFQKFDRSIFKNEDLFDTETQGVLDKIVDHYESAIEQHVMPQVQSMQEAFTQMQFSSEVERFDSLVSGMGETWKSVFGEGESLSLDPNTAEAKARSQVFDEMDVLRSAAQATGRRVPPDKELFDRAVRNLYRDRFKQEARQEIGSKLRDSRGRFLKPPTQRESVGKGGTPEERAANFATNFKRERGGYTEDEF